MNKTHAEYAKPPTTRGRSTPGDRGFVQFDEILDTYGARVRVKESSAAVLDAVWIFVDGGRIDNNSGAAHLDAGGARAVRDALTAWLIEHDYETGNA